MPILGTVHIIWAPSILIIVNIININFYCATCEKNLYCDSKPRQLSLLK